MLADYSTGAPKISMNEAKTAPRTMRDATYQIKLRNERGEKAVFKKGVFKNLELL